LRPASPKVPDAINLVDTRRQRDPLSSAECLL
jgi:hypothetical protein